MRMPFHPQWAKCMSSYLTAMQPSTEAVVYPGIHGLKCSQRKKEDNEKTEANKE